MPDWKAEIARRLASLKLEPAREAEITEELAQHLEDRFQELVSGGEGEDRAQHTALSDLRDEDLLARGLRGVEQEAPEKAIVLGSSGGHNLLSSLWHDIRYGLRLLRQSWAFSLVTVIILALCIGANSAVLSVVNAAMVRPLPYPNPSRLFHLVATFPQASNPPQTNVDGTTWQLVRNRVSALQVSVYGSSSSGGVNMAVHNRGIFVRQGRVSAGFFGVLGIPPFIGHEFTAAEDRSGGPDAVILSYRLWQKYFAGDPHVLGRSILLIGAPYTVVGVMPHGFEWNNANCRCSAADLWTPLRPSTTGEGEGANYGVIARLRPGATLQEAEAQLALVTEEVHRRGGLSYGPDSHVRLGLVPLREAMTEDLSQPLRLLWIAVAGIFLLGCVNIGGMLLARASGRMSEFTTRMALGATPSRILRQILVESLMLGAGGGMAGLGVGYIGLGALQGVGRRAFPFLQYVNLDWRVVAATLVLTLLAAIGFGLFPAWHAARSDPRLAQTGSRTVAGRRRHFSLGAMVAAQVALAIALLMAAVLLLRAFLFLWNFPAGFNPDHAIAAQFSLQDARYATAKSVNHLFDTVIDRLNRTPGIESAAVGLSLPYQRALNSGFRFPGSTQGHTINETYVSPEYFAALGIPILWGRAFTDADGPQAARVAIVNESFARHYLKGRRALGAELVMGSGKRKVVGVADNVVGGNPGWGTLGPVSDYPVVYIPVAQTSGGFFRLVHVWFGPSWVVRSSLPVREAARDLTNAVHAADPLLPSPVVRSFNDLKTSALDQQRLLASLVDALAVLAMILAALGIYGLIANLVAERTREMGIRIALGSTPTRATWTVLAPGLRWVLFGAGAGALVTLGFNELLKSFLWGIRPSDPLTLITVPLIITAVALLACYFPARRATKVDPMVALRNE